MKLQSQHWPKGKNLNGFLPKSQYSSHTRRQAFHILRFGCLPAVAVFTRKALSNLQVPSQSPHLLLHPQSPFLLSNFFANVAQL